jgi:hypothetical protein
MSFLLEIFVGGAAFLSLPGGEWQFKAFVLKCALDVMKCSGSGSDRKPYQNILASRTQQGKSRR